MFIWRPVLEGLASRAEIKEKWDLVDLLEAHEVLDLRLRAQDHMMKEGMKRG
jgi:hypothetical protein